MIYEAKILRNTRKISISASHKKKFMDTVCHANGILFWLLFAFDSMSPCIVYAASKVFFLPRETTLRHVADGKQTLNEIDVFAGD